MLRYALTAAALAGAYVAAAKLGIELSVAQGIVYVIRPAGTRHPT